MPRFAFALLLLSAIASLAQDPVYVSTGPAGQVLALWSNGTVQEVYSDNRFAPEDGTVGPDGLLYFADPTYGRVVRIRPADGTAYTVFPERSRPTNAPLIAPQGPRFDRSGNLYFTDSLTGSLYRLAGVAGKASGFGSPQLVAQRSAPGSGGTAFSHKGDLYFAAGATVYSAAGTAAFSARAPIRGLARAGNGDLIVAAATALKRCVSGTVDCAPLYTFTGDVPYYVEVAADNSLWVATSDSQGANGKLWKFDLNSIDATSGLLAGGSSVPLPRRGSTGVPAVGVAIPASSKTLSEAAIPVGSNFFFNFGADGLELSVIQCGLSSVGATVSSSQRLPFAVNARLLKSRYAGAEINPTAVLESGQEGFARVFHVELDSDCGPSALFGVGLYAFWPEPYAINPAVARCPTVALPDGSLPACEILDNYGYWIFSGLLPEDGAVATRTKGFSELIFVNVPFRGQEVSFGGFLSPFDPRSSDPNYASVFTSGQNITIKFQATLKGKRVTDLVALLSVERVAPGTPRAVPVVPSGSSNDPPLFRYSAVASQYIYNLSTSGPDWQPGVRYAAHVTAINGFKPQTVYFCLDYCPPVQ